MTIFNPPKFVTRGVIGAMGLSAIAFSMTAPAAHAGKLGPGKDFWKTPEAQVLTPEINLPADFFFPGSDPLTITAGFQPLIGHPIEDLMGMLPGPAEQNPEICFDRHGDQVSGASEHAVDCIPPEDPDMDLAWTDTIVERLEDSTQLSEIGDMAIIPIQLKKVSLVGTEDFIVTGGSMPMVYNLKAVQDDDVEQLIGNLKLTVNEVEKMGNMTFIRGIPSIGLNENCSLDPQAPNFDPNCLGLPVSFDLAFKKADTGELTQTFFSNTIFLEDGTIPGNEEDVFFSFKKPVPEPLTILGSFTALGFGTFFKRKVGKKAQQDKA